jgi:DNA adenine methylase
VARYDRPHTFFYVDPPYWACEDDYGKGIFASDDFQRLADQLGGIRGQFMLSINDVPEIREIFRGFNVREGQTRYTVCKSKGKGVVTELLVMNYEP